MLDTTVIRLNLNLYQQKNYLLQNLHESAELKPISQNLKTGEIQYEGWLKNYRVYVYGYYVTLSGSLAKYYQGENVTLLKKEGISQALKNLTKETGIPIEQGLISRVDLADNLMVFAHPSEYIKLLMGIPKGYMRNRQGTRYFHKFSKTQTAVWYNKQQELEDKYPLLHLDHKDKGHLLRSELRLESKIGQMVGQDDIRVFWLHSAKFLDKLAALWVKNYKRTLKMAIEIPPVISSLKEMGHYADYQLIMENSLILTT